MSKDGSRLRDRRKQLGLTLDEVAEKLGYQTAARRTAIHRVEATDMSLPSERLHDWANVLHTNVFYLLGLTDYADISDDELLKYIEFRKRVQEDPSDEQQ